jgi:muconolactone delta-isomerase
MNCARRRQCAPLSSPKQAIWSGSGARRSVQANGAALGCSAPPTRQSFEVLASLPIHIWMKATITPLTPHPNDPEYRARQAMDHPQA